MAKTWIYLTVKKFYNMNKMSGIVSFRKNILVWLGDRTTAPSLLVRALYRCDHQAVDPPTNLKYTNKYNILYNDVLGIKWRHQHDVWPRDYSPEKHVTAHTQLGLERRGVWRVPRPGLELEAQHNLARPGPHVQQTGHQGAGISHQGPHWQHCTHQYQGMQGGQAGQTWATFTY